MKSLSIYSINITSDNHKLYEIQKSFKIILVEVLILLYYLFSLSDNYSIILLCLSAIILGTIIHFLVEFIGNYLYKNKK